MRLEHLLSGARDRRPVPASGRHIAAKAKRLGDKRNDNKARQSYAVLLLNIYCNGGLAQLARAPALQAGGQRFESVILHNM